MSVPEHQLIFGQNAPQFEARWPERIIEIAEAWPSVADDRARERLLGEFWLLLNAALTKYLRVHSTRFNDIDVEDLRDIASEKTLVLLGRFDSDTWNPSAWAPAQLTVFVSRMARNGLIDHHRVVASKRGGAEDPRFPVAEAATARSSPELTVDRQQFATAVCSCARNMSPRARTVWFLRVLLGMPSRAIAAHPEVRMKVGAVDMMLARCRRHMSKGMRALGYESKDIPPGVLATLWEALRAEFDDTPSKPESTP